MIYFRSIYVVKCYGYNRELTGITHSFPTRRCSEPERSVARPFAGRHSIQSGRRLPEPGTIDPEIGQNPLDIDSRLARRDALDEEQRIVLIIDALAPLAEISEEHTSELQSLMRISYAVFCLKKKHRHAYTILI